MAIYIRKSSGKKELFDIDKFRRSLKKAGANAILIDHLVQQLERHPKLQSTKQIYGYALTILQQEQPYIAARYNIKKALLDMGPAGFPFEKFIGEIFRCQGYQITVGPTEKGFCIGHELDIIAKKDSTQLMIECKFHNRPQLKTDVKVTLYCKARFDDIKKAWETDPQKHTHYHTAWIVTNTKFTSEAIRYASCVGIELLGWAYPADANLPMLIDRFGLYPITTIPSLSRAQKHLLIKEGFVLCRDVDKFQHVMKQLGMSKKEITTSIAEMHDLCTSKNHVQEPCPASDE